MRVAYLMQPHTFGWLMIMFFCIAAIVDSIRFISHFRLLDPDTFQLPDFNATSSGTEFATLSEDLRVTAVLRGLALLSPLSVMATFVVTFMHLCTFFPRKRGFDDDLRWYPQFSYDLAMQVTVLPLVYGIFALSSLNDYISLVTGSAFQWDPESGASARHLTSHYARVLNHVERTNSVNFELADLYEAWALYNFGRLCFIRVERRMDMELPAVQYVIKRVKQLLDHRQNEQEMSASSKSSISQLESQGSRDAAVLGNLSILHDPQKMLFNPLKETSLMGVKAFVYTYGAKSLYMLGVYILEDKPFNWNLGQWASVPYMDGAAFFASTLAIYNIIIFERKLGEFLTTGDFKPMEKFLGVKVLVSIAFLQSYGLQLLMGNVAGYSKYQVDLCYTSLICLEVLPLSILVLFAWKPSSSLDDWYSEDRYDIPQDGKLRGQLAREPEKSQEERDRERMEAMGRVIQESVDSPRRAASKARQSLVWQEAPATIELSGHVSNDKGRAIETLVNTLAQDMNAVYRPAVLHRLLDKSPTNRASSPLRALSESQMSEA